MKETHKYFILSAIVAASFAAVFFIEPLPQSMEYHNFADRRTFLGVINAWDVFSNFPFLLAGIYGFFSAKKVRPFLRPSWNLCFLGVAMVFFGSAWYHLNPNNDTLVWDRLPMAVGFMGLFSAVMGEFVSEKTGKNLLIPSLSVGLFSIIYWNMYDDLRFYIWVQGIPLVIILVSVFLFKNKYSHQNYLGFAFLFYALAKVFEYFDRAVYELTGGLAGGHALKHILAALSVFMLARMLDKRNLQSSPG